MVGRLLCVWGPAYFQGQTVKLQVFPTGRNLFQLPATHVEGHVGNEFCIILQELFSQTLDWGTQDFGDAVGKNGWVNIETKADIKMLTKLIRDDENCI